MDEKRKDFKQLAIEPQVHRDLKTLASKNGLTIYEMVAKLVGKAMLEQ